MTDFGRIEWEDLRFPATAINPPGLVSDPTFDSTNVGWLFDPASTEILFLIAQLPHAWYEGSTVVPHVHWEPTTAGAGNVYWRYEYQWTNINATEAGFSTVNIQDAADGTAYKHQFGSFGNVSGTGKTFSSIISIKLSRIGGDALDTYGDNALLKEFDIHYQVIRHGTRLEDSN